MKREKSNNFISGILSWIIVSSGFVTISGTRSKHNCGVWDASTAGMMAQMLLGPLKGIMLDKDSKFAYLNLLTILKLYFHLWFLRPDLTLLLLMCFLSMKTLTIQAGWRVKSYTNFQLKAHMKGRCNKQIKYTSSSPRELPGKWCFLPSLGEKRVANLLLCSGCHIRTWFLPYEHGSVKTSTERKM